MLDPIDTVSTFSEVSHGNPNALADALDLLAEAIAGQRPIAAEMCLITALTAGARPGHRMGLWCCVVPNVRENRPK